MEAVLQTGLYNLSAVNAPSGMKRAPSVIGH